MEAATLFDLLARYEASSEREMWSTILDRTRSAGDTLKTDIAERALAKLPAEVDVLDSMRAGAEIVARLTGWRWTHIRRAREEGRSWTEIGEALGITGQAARELYKTAIEFQEQPTPPRQPHDAPRTRSALDDGGGCDAGVASIE